MQSSLLNVTNGNFEKAAGMQHLGWNAESTFQLLLKAFVTFLEYPLETF